ncbi:FAD/NAD(P)-binding oxidoreductase [Lentibacillus saliphilus]|uniref:FAD/NAD(P)-binding oxidoreductase n=1 Tax=Lentibacillus saliphilus TaxID=2737028 RepID=UPI001C30F443|nr:FAD/NAD(P)-binding oxidoreductase [Lentibacillus saliphilus]
MGKSHYKVVIVGGGTAGISVTSRLLRGSASLRQEIAIIDPAEHHDYQPLWTLVGGGAAKVETTRRPMKSVIPDGADWVQDYVTRFSPDDNRVHLANNEDLTYDYLVVAAGIEINWDGIKGLKDNIGKNGVTSNYAYEYASYTWELIRSFKGGTALFTHPNSPVKCGGAPQKIMYLAEDYFSRTGVRDASQIIFGSANPAIFDVDKYRTALEKVVERKEIDTRFRTNLIEIRGENKQAVFEHLDTKEQKVIDYDMLHVTPPMQAPAFIKESALADENGWVDVHKHTLQHVRYENIFGLGDNSNLPTSKTGAAIRKQAPLVAQNILALMKMQPLGASYNGYTSCPVVTGYNKLILAEFDYDKRPQESMPFDQGKERKSMYVLKKDLLPVMYWNGMLKGTM